MFLLSLRFCCRRLSPIQYALGKRSMEASEELNMNSKVQNAGLCSISRSPALHKACITTPGRSMNWGSFQGALLIRALLFGVHYIKAADCWKLPHTLNLKSCTRALQTRNQTSLGGPCGSWDEVGRGVLLDPTPRR